MPSALSGLNPHCVVRFGSGGDPPTRYELYEQCGRVDGFALDDWLQAESEIPGTKKPGSKSKQLKRRR